MMKHQGYLKNITEFNSVKIRIHEKLNWQK